MRLVYISILMWKICISMWGTWINVCEEYISIRMWESILSHPIMKIIHVLIKVYILLFVVVLKFKFHMYVYQYYYMRYEMSMSFISSPVSAKKCFKMIFFLNLSLSNLNSRFLAIYFTLFSILTKLFEQFTILINICILY